MLNEIKLSMIKETKERGICSYVAFSLHLMKEQELFEVRQPNKTKPWISLFSLGQGICMNPTIFS